MEALYHGTLPTQGALASPEVNDDFRRRTAAATGKLEALYMAPEGLEQVKLT